MLVSRVFGLRQNLIRYSYQTAYAHRTDSTPIHIQHAVNVRPLLDTLSDHNVPYINNAFSYISIPPLPASAFSALSLSALALRSRRAILDYKTDPDRIRRSLAQFIVHPLKAILPCPPDATFEVFSNWRSAKLNELDFTSASAGGGKARVIYTIASVSGMRFMPLRGAEGLFLSEDEEVLWMGSSWGRKEWETIRRGGQLAFVS